MYCSEDVCLRLDFSFFIILATASDLSSPEANMTKATCDNRTRQAFIQIKTAF